MDYFGRSARQFENMQRRYGTMPPEAEGLTQLGGAILSDIQESKAMDAAEAEAKRQERNSMILGGREMRRSARGDVMDEMATQRTGNLAGFDRLTDMRKRAMDNSLKYSTRRSFLSAMGG